MTLNTDPTRQTRPKWSRSVGDTAVGAASVLWKSFVRFRGRAGPGAYCGGQGVIAAVGIGLLMILLASGCNIVGPAYLLVAGPGEVKAAYKLDPERKTVIFVDDPANKIAQRRIRVQIGTVAQDILLEKRLVLEGNMIDTRSAIAAAARGDSDKPLAITEIGEAVGAEIVVYVLVTRFGLSGDGVEFAPTSEIEVKVFDATTHTRLWPPAGEPGYRTTFSDPGGNRNMPRTRTDSLRAQSDLAQLTGYGLAQLFYDVERPQSLRR